MKYQILIKHQDGSTSYMIHNDRTSWTRPVAKRHLTEFIAKLVAGYFPHIAYAAMVTA